MDKTALLDLVDKFITGKDCSIATANKIEVAIDDAFPDNEFIQDTVLMLASYRPGGGDFLYNEEALKGRLRKLKERLSDHK